MESTVVESNERRNGFERRSGEDRRLVAAAGAVFGSMEEEATPGAERTRLYALEVTGYVVAAILGLFVYKVTGLYDAADSAVVRVGLGAIIAFWFVLNVRVAFHAK
jgi:hypothetical protein